MLSEEVKWILLYLRYFWIFENRFSELVEIVIIFLKVLMSDVCIKNIVTNEKNSIISATFFEVADIFSQMDISICLGYMKLGRSLISL